VSRVLNEKWPDCKIVVCEPQLAPLIGSGADQERNDDDSPASTHSAFQPHPMQGWTPDFIPKITSDAIDAGVIDTLLTIEAPDAMRLSRALATQEGIFVGISAGATLAGAIKVAEDAPEGSTILCMLPDTGERYLTTPLFAEIEEAMNDDEVALSRSTPNFQLG
jgi:cysteine synthase A